jgi:Cu/Ag efflux pump CusA
VALLITPALSLALAAKKSQATGKSPFVAAAERLYQGLLGAIVQAPMTALITAAVFMLVGLALVLTLSVDLMPSFKRTHFRINWDGAPGTSGVEMNRIATQAVRELNAIPGVRNVATHVGRAETGDAVVGINSGEIWVNLDPTADYEATEAAVQEVVDGYTGLSRQVETYQPDRISQAISGPDKELVVRIYGHDLPLLREKAEEVRELVAATNGIIEAEVDLVVEEPQVEIEPLLEATESYGLKPGDVRRQATTLLSGLQVGSLFEEQKVFEVVVWGVPEVRSTLSNISDLLIETPNHEQVPLSEVADIRIAPVPVSIKRDTVSRYIDIGANVSGRSLNAVVADLKSQVGSVEVPFEFHIEVLNDSIERQAAQQRMLAVAVAAVIGIFLLMQAAVGSWRLAAVLFVTLPMALTGGVMAAFIGGGVLTLGSLFGFFAIFGLAIRNNLVMVKRFHYLTDYEDEEFGLELVLRGARERLGPILATTLAAALALLPFIVAGPIAGNEILHSVAMVVLGGLLTSTLLNLFVVPALYLRYGPGYEPSLEEETQLSDEPRLGLA